MSHNKWNREERVEKVQKLKEKINKEIEEEIENALLFQKTLLSEEILDKKRYNYVTCIIFCLQAFYDYTNTDTFLMEMYRINPDIYIVSEDVIGCCLQDNMNVASQFVYANLLNVKEKKSLDIALNIMQKCNDEYFEFEFVPACDMILYKEKNWK